MDRLLEHFAAHPLLASLAVAMAVAVLVFELRRRGQTQASINSQEAIQLMNQGAQLIDLRDAAAFAAGHVAGARHIVLEDPKIAAESLKKHKGKTLVLCCESGALSSNATRFLQAGGFDKVFALRGGLAQWRGEGLPLKKA